MKKQKRKLKRTNSQMPVLSIVIVSFNTSELLRKCLESLENVVDEVNFEVIVVDNGSTDDSVTVVKSDFKWVKLIVSNENLGFAKANNLAKNIIKGKYVLFLNSDTVVKKNTLKSSIYYLENNPEVGALTCKLVLPSGELDKDVRRSFPTPWVAFTHLVLPLDRIFTDSPTLAKYWYTYVPEDEKHEIDVLQGAFFLTRKKILDDVGWFDEDYFLDGEDIDLSWKIKQKGWKNLYFPEVEIIHIKGASKGKKNRVKKITRQEKLKYRLAGVNSMEIFYKKRLWDKYPIILNLLVVVGLRSLKLIRTVKIYLLG